MPVTVVVGGQYGSEGKGKVAHYLATQLGASIAVRVGGPNSGHTAFDASGRQHILRQLPTAALLPDVLCILPAGSYIDPSVLREEITRTGISAERLVIDGNATVIEDIDITAEESSELKTAIGSTATGVGAALVRRMQRRSTEVLAREHPTLKSYVGNVSALLRAHLGRRQRIVIEGTQGFGLSLLHSPHYPFATSRDTTASAALAETGLAPTDVDDIVLVVRSFPIRVPGNSGPLPNETDWSTLTIASGAPTPLEEVTSVTRRRRRIARFDPWIVRSAIEANQPSRIVLNHLDYVDWRARSLAITPKVIEFLHYVEGALTRKIDLLGTSPTQIIPNPCSHRSPVSDPANQST